MWGGVTLSQFEQKGLLLFNQESGELPPTPGNEILSELENLASEAPEKTDCSRYIFLRLRKAMGTPRFVGLLQGIQYLARAKQPAGALLLAAFMDTTTVEARLIPQLAFFSSSRRIHLILKHAQREANLFSKDWLKRKEDLVDQVLALRPEIINGGVNQKICPEFEQPWIAMRHALAVSLEEVHRKESPSPKILGLIGDLVCLEVDALEERASRLAGLTNPFRAAAVMRLSSILGRLDPQIRDTRLFISSLREGDLDSIFRKRWSRALEVMEPEEYQQFLLEMGEHESVSALSRIHVAQVEGVSPLDQLAVSPSPHGQVEDHPAQPDSQPAPPDGAQAPGDSEEEVKESEMGASQIKTLVMESMQSTSALLSFLKNAKVTSVPGLVAEVATRTRNPQIISTIASDRTLYTGFANRDVPLNCLRNPSNVSVKTLRRFIHVKFVSKIDLKRMSQDKAGVRRELRLEIEKYLNSLA